MANHDEITTAQPPQTLERVITITPEMFEKLYLTPKTSRGSQGGKHFANPTAMGFVGFVVSALTFSMILMGWGGALNGTAVAGVFLFVGPVLLLVSVIMEWVMGNFLPMTIMAMFCVFWLSVGLLQLPTLGLAAFYSDSGTNASEGLASQAYNAALALYLIVWGVILLTFFVFSLKTNVVFAAIMFTTDMACWLLSGAYWRVASGDDVLAGHLQKAGGAFLFVTGVLGWYMTLVIGAVEMGMWLGLPLGDLSHLWPSTGIAVQTADKASSEEQEHV